MIFSSALFLYVFIPVFFSLYYLLPGHARNWLILSGSLLFYAIGAGSTVVVLIGSIYLNQFLATRFSSAAPARRRTLLIVGITLNLLGIIYYKYTSFLWQETARGLSALGFHALPQAPQISLPIGISFFTFQAISYLIDVYRSDIFPAAAGYGAFATYHSLFPQLVAGPIVRYSEIRAEMDVRRIDHVALTEGAYRFCLGLGKKVVLADNIGGAADAAFALPSGQLDSAHAWVGILCYSLQIYFDFSGYSDMAIGLGRLLGFHFLENFNQPYRSQNVTEFWRRWHMTLSRWFRDYLYIPLGGNRGGMLRTAINLWIVFFLCGLWHGAGLTFIVWGLYHGLLLSLERVLDAWLGWRPRGIVGTVLTFALVTIGWVFFRAPDLPTAAHYLATMFSVASTPTTILPLGAYLSPDVQAYLTAALIFAFVPFERLGRLRFDRPGTLAGQLSLSGASLAYSSLLLAANSFNPFIYFRF